MHLLEPQAVCEPDFQRELDAERLVELVCESRTLGAAITGPVEQIGEVFRIERQSPRRLQERMVLRRAPQRRGKKRLPFRCREAGKSRQINVEQPVVGHVVSFVWFLARCSSSVSMRPLQNTRVSFSSISARFPIASSASAMGSSVRLTKVSKTASNAIVAGCRRPISKMRKPHHSR